MSDFSEEIPAGWLSMPLGQMTRVDWGNTAITKNCYVSHGFPAYSAAGQDGFVTQAEHHGPGIVVSAIGTVGISRYAEGDWTAIKNTITVTDFAAGLIPKFVFYQTLMRDFWPTKGANQQFIPVTEARNITFRLPPTNEQRRIVAKLDALQSRTRLARKALAAIPTLLDHYRQSVLAAYTDQGEILDWPEVNFSDLVLSVDQGWSPQCDSDRPADGDWGVIKTTAVQKRHFFAKESKRLPAGLIPQPELAVKAGDVLITRAGPRVRCGVTCYVPESNERLMICDKVYRIRVRDELVSARFLCELLNSPRYMEEIEILKTGSSDSGMNLTMGRLASMKVRVPSRLEQNRLVGLIDHHMSRADACGQVLNSVGREVDHLDQSLLATAFRGELVPQDPTDEPASVLLDRIRAARAQAGDAPRTRRPRSTATPPAPSPAAIPVQPPPATTTDPYATLLAALRTHGSLASADAQAATGLDATAVRPLLQRLVAEGAAQVEGQKRGTRYVAT